MSALDEAGRFISVMAGAEPATFQTFDDRAKDRALASILHGQLAKHGKALEDLNDHGAGIFVMVNQGDGRGRRASNVTAVRALFLDLDGAPLGPVLDAGVEPHAIVESSSDRWHLYWLVADCALEQFKPMQQALAARFGGDRAVCDLPRVMRLPGFLHQKAEPFRTRIESLAPELPPYRVADLVQRLGLAVPAAAQTDLHRRAQRNLKQSSDSSDSSESSDSSVQGRELALDGAAWAIPAGTIPTEAGQRHDCLFKLARHAKGMQPEPTKQELRGIVRCWHELALPAIRTLDFGTSFGEFMSGYERVKQPHGAVMDAIIDNIDNIPLPAGIDALGYGKSCNLLVRICAALQAHAGDEPFFLGARQAGDLVGVPFTDANRMLQALVLDGVIAVVTKGAGRKATRFRFVWMAIDDETESNATEAQGATGRA